MKFPSMVGALVAVALSSIGVAPAGTPPASAAPDTGAATALAPPDVPAQAWLVADLGRPDPRFPRALLGPCACQHDQALLAMVVLDHLRPESAIRASETSTQVECSCIGFDSRPGLHGARQLLDGLLVVRATTPPTFLADMLGGYQTAVVKMNAKAFAIGARSTKAGSPPVSTGRDEERDIALRPGSDLPGCPEPSAVRPDHPSVVGDVPFRQQSVQDDHQPGQAAAPVPGFIGGKSGYTDLARDTYVGIAQRDGRRLIAVEMYGDGDLRGE